MKYRTVTQWQGVAKISWKKIRNYEKHCDEEPVVVEALEAVTNLKKQRSKLDIERSLIGVISLDVYD